MMRRFYPLVLLLLSVASASVAQSADDQTKKGWNFGPFPAVGYNSDMGFQYGAYAEIFHFGDGSNFPDYEHKFTLEASTYTKGSSVLNFAYDSKYLIPNIRSTFTISYLPDKMMDFYGFNGYASPYDSTLGESFYKIDREYFRTYLDFQGRIVGNFNWAAGLAFYNYSLSTVQIDKYVSEDNLLTEYLNSGVLTEDDLSGRHLEIRAGLVHDTRDSEADPWRGFFTEVVALASPDLFEGEDASFGQLSLTHRGYIPVVGEKLTLAYRALVQLTTFGEVPAYQLQNITTLLLRKTTSEGLGGSETLRGALRNRAVGAGYFLSNIELRYRFAHFNFIGQKWYYALNPFVDLGQVIQPYRLEEMEASGNELIYNGGDESLHVTVGAGVKLAMNRNFILSAEYGKALEAQDGTSSLMIGVSFLF